MGNHACQFTFQIIISHYTSVILIEGNTTARDLQNGVHLRAVHIFYIHIVVNRIDFLSWCLHIQSSKSVPSIFYNLAQKKSWILVFVTFITSVIFTFSNAIQEHSIYPHTRSFFLALLVCACDVLYCTYIYKTKERPRANDPIYSLNIFTHQAN